MAPPRPFRPTSFATSFARPRGDAVRRIDRISFAEFAQVDRVVTNISDVQYALYLYSVGSAAGGANAYSKADFKRAVRGTRRP